jgi:hypothetical protein
MGKKSGSYTVYSPSPPSAGGYWTARVTSNPAAVTVQGSPTSSVYCPVIG